MKKFLLILTPVLFLTATLLTIYMTSVKEADSPYSQEMLNNTKIRINGEYIKSKPLILLIDDKAYIQLRPLCEAMSYGLNWDNDTKVLTVSKGADNIKIQPGINTATVTKEHYRAPDTTMLKHAPVLNGDSLFMELTDISSLFDIKIDFIKKELIIDMSYNNLPVSYITFNDGLGKTILPYTYSDSYFNTSSAKYSPDLADLSIVLSSASHSKQAITEALKDMGYQSNMYNYDNSQKNLAAYSIGRKDTGNSSAIYIVAIRGTTGNEWSSNFDIYENEDTPSSTHYGFAQAEEKIYKTLEEYLKEFTSDKKRTFLITGHSRGGAIANLLAYRLTKDGTYASSDSIFAYTFATPNVSLQADKKLKNIHNFCNESDFITKIPFNGKDFNPDETQWLYGRHGTTVCLNRSAKDQESITKEMDTIFRQITGEEFSHINKSSVDNVANLIKSLLPTVKDYYTRKISVGNNKMSVYQFLSAGITAMQNPGEMKGDMKSTLTEGLFRGDLASVARFIVLNSCGTLLKNEDGTPSGKSKGVIHNHCCEAYYAWIKAYNKCR